VSIPITVAGGGSAGAFPVEVALVLDGAALDAGATWVAAEPADAGTVQVLVGPGGAVEPAPGDYTIYVRIAADPERPVLRSGPITIM